MDRRATLSKLLGKSSNAQRAVKTATVVSGLDPYSGTWGYEQAAHLLRRTMYGPSNNQIKNAVQAGLENTIQQLLTINPIPEPPIHYVYEEDPAAPLGTSWVDKPYNAVNFNTIRSNRNHSLKAWTAKLVYEEGVSIREKMTMFWHNHFVTSDIQDPKLKYDYISRLRANALGNFRNLVKKVTIDPSMLRYLNGNQNTKTAPNENYARELLELFTIGKGPLIAPNNYTNYTEDDVVAMARVLTGWRDRGNNTTDPDIEVGSYFTANRHDEGSKTLSEAFDFIEISNGGENEYSTLIDIIFQKQEVAFFISRKIYRWFVFSEINDDVEMNVIAPMAQVLIDNDYEIVTVIDALIRSEHFYDEANRGCMIKNPWDFVFGLIKELEIEIPGSNVEIYWRTMRSMFDVPNALQMEYYNHPSVAGWSAYYQEPSYYQLWANSVTLPFRSLILTIVATAGVGVPGNDDIDPTIAEPDLLGMVAAFENPLEAYPVIDEFIRMLLPKDITQNQKEYLLDVLTDTLGEQEWNMEYSEHASDPTNTALADAIRNRIKNLLLAMLLLPEYQLS